MTDAATFLKRVLGKMEALSWDSSLSGLYDIDYDWRIGAERVYKLQYITTVPGYDYKKSKFFHTRAKPNDSSDILATVDHLSTLLNVICNSLVILVFVRVIGLQRLPSGVLVNLAAALMCESVASVLHSTQLGDLFFSDDAAVCRFVPQFHHAVAILFSDTMTAGLIERFIALNVPSYYNLAIGIIGPTVILSPWLGFVINIVIINVGFLEFDLGYECYTQFNLWLPDASMNAGVAASRAITITFAVTLWISTLFQSRNSGDALEANLSKLEVKTSGVLLKIFFLYMASTLPFIVIWFISKEGGLTKKVEAFHFVQQIVSLRGACLLVVLMGRRDFSHQILLIFESSDNIRRNRTANLLLASQSSHLDIARRDRGKIEDSGVQKVEPLPKPEPAALIPRARDDFRLASYIEHDEVRSLVATQILSDAGQDSRHESNAI